MSIIAIIAVVMIGMIFLKKMGFFRVMPSDTDGKVFGDEYYESIDLLNNKLKTNIYVYGDDIVFDTDVNYEKIDDLSEFKMSKTDDYDILIINDEKTDLHISDKQWEKVKSLLDENDNFFFYYFGKRSNQKLAEYKIADDFQDDDICTGVVMNNGSRCICTIMSDSDLHVGNNEVADTYRPGQLIIESIGFYIESNY